MQKEGWTLISRSEIDFAPGENTFGLHVVKEIWRTQSDAVRTYFKTNRPDVVMIVAFDAARQLIATTEFQPGVGAVYPKMPGGSVEADQTPEEAAHAELLEETGYQAREMKLVTTMAFDSGSSDRKIFIFLATDCEKVGEPEEGIRVRAISPQDFLDLFFSYLLTDPKKVHGGANSLQAITTAFASLGILRNGATSW
jgi:ADP-ribose pyrophosphatase